MLITDIWLDSKLKELFIESKNTRIKVWTRKIWSFEVRMQQGPHYCANPRNSVPEGCKNILATHVHASFQPQFVLEVAL